MPKILAIGDTKSSDAFGNSVNGAVFISLTYIFMISRFITKYYRT